MYATVDKTETESVPRGSITSAVVLLETELTDQYVVIRAAITIPSVS